MHDHIPLSSDGEIKVRLRETSPNPAEQTDLGELIWKFELDQAAQPGSPTVSPSSTPPA